MSSYATFNESGDLYYFSGSTPIPSRPSGLAEDNGGYLTEAIYFAKKTGSSYGPSEFLAALLPASPPRQKIGVGDPWISPKGDYIIYTIYDDAIGWRASVNLVISFTSAVKQCDFFHRFKFQTPNKNRAPPRTGVI